MGWLEQASDYWAVTTGRRRNRAECWQHTRNIDVKKDFNQKWIFLFGRKKKKEKELENFLGKDDWNGVSLFLVDSAVVSQAQNVWPRWRGDDEKRNIPQLYELMNVHSICGGFLIQLEAPSIECIYKCTE